MPTNISSKPILLTGGCRCGAVTYTSTMIPARFTNCHCTTCRQLSGSPYLPFANFSGSALSWNDPSSSLKKTSYSTIAERGHCAQCGSPLYMKYEEAIDDGDVGICMGSIDLQSVRGEGLKQVHRKNIFLLEKASWFEVPEGEEKFEEHEERFQKRIDAFLRLEVEGQQGKEGM